MKRLILILCLLPLTVFAEKFTQGNDYQLIKQTANTQNNNSNIIVVNEFFSYGCPWCYKLEPAITRWAPHLSHHVKLTKVPVVFEKGWNYYAKAYYLAESLGITDKISPMLFDAIQNKRHKLKSDQAMINFFVEQGVNKLMAESAFNSSPLIDSKVRQGMQLMQSYTIYGVPAMVINGEYKTDLQMAKSNQRLLKIVDFLISKVEKKHLIKVKTERKKIESDQTNH